MNSTCQIYTEFDPDYIIDLELCQDYKLKEIEEITSQEAWFLLYLT